MDQTDLNEASSSSSSMSLSALAIPSTSSASSSVHLDDTFRDRSSSESSIGSNDSILLGLPITLIDPGSNSRPLRTSIDLSSMNLTGEAINQNLDKLISPQPNGHDDCDLVDKTTATLPVTSENNSNENPSGTIHDDDDVDENAANLTASADETCTSSDCICDSKSEHKSITSLNLSNNQLTKLPSNLSNFTSLTTLDISENGLDSLEPMFYLPTLTVLIACNNKLTDDSLIKCNPCKNIPNIKVLSLSGNQFRSIPKSILDCGQLRSLYLGANFIEQIPITIAKLTKLRYLYLGGNKLTTIPEEVGLLSKLEALSLCENSITSLPPSIANLTSLKSLALHMNQLTTLPTEIVKLQSLTELSLRNNPLVVRFINDYLYSPPSLLELAGRCIKVNRIHYPGHMIPRALNRYLDTAQHCVNPQCQGVYFDSRIEQIKFVDFCGSYRLPLLQYLCSSKCTKTSSSADNTYCSDRFELNVSENKMKRVLLG